MKYGWMNISDYNKAFKQTVSQEWLHAVVMDVEAMLSMRADCRSDYLHMNLGKFSEANGLYFLPRIFQAAILEAQRAQTMRNQSLKR